MFCTHNIQCVTQNMNRLSFVFYLLFLCDSVCPETSNNKILLCVKCTGMYLIVRCSRQYFSLIDTTCIVFTYYLLAFAWNIRDTITAHSHLSIRHVNFDTAIRPVLEFVIGLCKCVGITYGCPMIPIHACYCTIIIIIIIMAL